MLQRWNDRNHLMARLLLVAAVLTAAACGGKKFKGTPPIIREAGSVKVSFGETALTVLPPVEGPYVFVKALSPTVVQLSDAQSKQELFKLLGLSDEGYPEPTVGADGKPLPKPEPAEVERKRAAQAAYKTGELKKLFGASQIYIIRMSAPAPRMPSKIYALVPDSTQTPGKPPAGEATLLNALAVRNGVANMDLGPGAEQQPLFDTMLNAQLTEMIELKRKAGTPEVAETLWARFPMNLPPGPYADKLAQMEKK